MNSMSAEQQLQCTQDVFWHQYTLTLVTCIKYVLGHIYAGIARVNTVDCNKCRSVSVPQAHVRWTTEKC